MKKKFFSVLLAVVLILSLAISVSAASAADVYDEVDLLTSEEETQLAQKLSQISKQFNAQIVIMTVPSVDGSVDVFVENVFDGMDMGYGDNRDGVLLLVCMDPREYRILSNGYAADAITLDCIDAIGKAIVSDLSDGNYADAFNTFAEHCTYYLDGYVNGYPFDAGKSLIVALIVGIAAGVVTAFVLKNQLKSVRQQKQANAYIKTGSMQITASRDLYLYRQVSRTEKSSTQSSGSGSSRNVGGGSF